MKITGGGDKLRAEADVFLKHLNISRGNWGV